MKYCEKEADNFSPNITPPYEVDNQDKLKQKEDRVQWCAAAQGYRDTQNRQGTRDRTEILFKQWLLCLNTLFSYLDNNNCRKRD
jgi:hypothetical protein